MMLLRSLLLIVRSGAWTVALKRDTVHKVAPDVP